MKLSRRWGTRQKADSSAALRNDKQKGQRPIRRFWLRQNDDYWELRQNDDFWGLRQNDELLGCARMTNKYGDSSLRSE